MTKYEIICSTIEETQNLASRFADLAKGEGCFCALYGEIGAGKTAKMDQTRPKVPCKTATTGHHTQ